ncbi:MAG: Dam family site-specific DNA-(adenine-N6)-methyltransferase [Treponema sp.]|nr:Dam family site-specific DNA-(adenine-N6)-methyltransferase [Treponema sp.]
MPEIQKHIPKNINNYTYYEPFVGGGAVFFNLQPEKAVINDINEQLIHAYNAIKDNVDDLVKLLRNYAKENDKDFYYSIRRLDRDNNFDSLTGLEKAARLIYLNKTCYNGLYRVNSSGFFNVPYGKYESPAICETKTLHQISEYLNSNKIRVLCGDYEKAVHSADDKSFVYFDPPYHSPNRKNFTSYQDKEFNETDHERLRDIMIRLTDRGVKCLLSNSDTEFTRKLFEKDIFEVIPVQAKRKINSKSSGRGFVSEILVKNWKN